jgi:hypothetical protein
MSLMYVQAMKTFAAGILLFAVVACTGEKTEVPAKPKPAVQTETSAKPSEPAAEPVKGVWSGQVKIDAHAGTATFNYVGKESGDFVPMRFRTDSEVGAKILAQCADDDLCEFEGTVRFLDEPPPENASAVGEIVTVDRVKKLPPDAR